MDTPSPDETSQRYDLGVLFVHGMGDHKKGETLARFSTPIMRFLNDWNNPPASARDIVDPAVPTDTASAPFQESLTEAPVTARVVGPTLLRERGLAPSTTPWPETSVEIIGKDNRTPTRWLLREAWWADTFPPPSFSSVAKWGLGVGPRMIIRQFEQPRGNLMAGKIPGTDRDIPQGFRYAVALPVVVLFEILVVALLAFGAIPPLRSRVASLILRLTGSFGDVMTYVQPSLRSSAIQTAVKQALDDLRSRSAKVVVVAHSLGAAISFDVLSDETSPQRSEPIEHFVTFGAAIRKSRIFRQVRNNDVMMSWGAVLAWIGTILLATAAFSVLGKIRAGMDVFWEWTENPALPEFTSGPSLAWWAYAVGVSMAIVRLALWNSSFASIAQSTNTPVPPVPFWARAMGIGGLAIATVSIAYLVRHDALHATVLRMLPSSGSHLAWMLVLLPALATLQFALREWVYRRDREPGWYVVLKTASIYLALIFTTVALVDWSSPTERACALFLSGLCCSLAVIRVPFGNFPINDDFDAGAVRAEHWTDFWASSDPVPYREGPPQASASPQSIEIHNRNSLSGDHTVYEQNFEQFALPLTAILLRSSNTASAAGSVDVGLADAQRRRDARVRWLQIGRVVAVALAVIAPIVFGKEAMLRLSEWVFRLVLAPLRLITDAQTIEDIRKAIASPLAGLGIVALIIFVVFQYGLTEAWRLWDLSTYRELVAAYANRFRGQDASPTARLKRYRAAYVACMVIGVLGYLGFAYLARR